MKTTPRKIEDTSPEEIIKILMSKMEEMYSRVEERRKAEGEPAKDDNPCMTGVILPEHLRGSTMSAPRILMKIENGKFLCVSDSEVDLYLGELGCVSGGDRRDDRKSGRRVV